LPAALLPAPQPTCRSGIEWDQIYEDPQRRPGKVLVGYFCGGRGETLQVQDIRTIIKGIGVQMLDESTLAGKD